MCPDTPSQTTEGLSAPALGTSPSARVGSPSRSPWWPGAAASLLTSSLPFLLAGGLANHAIRDSSAFFKAPLNLWHVVYTCWLKSLSVLSRI